MPSTIRVRFDPADKLVFDIEVEAGQASIRSAQFRSICRLESALGLLHRLSESSAAPGVFRKLEATGLSEDGRRAQVTLQATLSAEQVAALLAQLNSARVVDERPETRRRSDVSGPLSQFHGH